MEDFLISTDVDRLIEILRRQKSADLDYLSRELDTPALNILKWVGALEDQGLVRIDYRLTRTLVNWTGADEETPRAAEPASQTADKRLPTLEQVKKETLPAHIPEAPEPKPDSGLVVSSASEIVGKTEEPAPKRKLPEKKITKRTNGSRDISIHPRPAMRAGTSIQGQFGPITKDMLTTMPRQMSVQLATSTSSQAEQKPQAGKQKPQSAARGGQQGPAGRFSAARTAFPEAQPTAAQGELLSGLPAELSEKLAQVRAQADEIARLKLEKERLLREAYLPLQTKLEAEIGAISERLLDKESQILQLQQRAAEIPAKASAIEKEYLKLNQLQSGARAAFDETANFIEQEGERLRQMHESIGGQVDALRAQMEEESAKIRNMGEQKAALLGLEKETKETLSSARRRMLEQANSLGALEDSLRSISSLQRKISAQADDAQEKLASQAETLETLQNKLSSLAKAESFVDSHFELYKRQMQEFDAYVSQSTEEYGRLRESIEANFTRLYLGKLRNVAEKYQYELEHISGNERELDMALAAARARLSGMIKEGMKLSYEHERQQSAKGSGPEPQEMIERRERMFASLAALSGENREVRGALGRASAQLRRQLPSGSKKGKKK